MTIELRVPTTGDWPTIHALANEALPDARDGNAAWLEARRAFDERRSARRHHLAVDGSGLPLAYGAVEGGEEPGRFRFFLVMDPARLQTDVARVLYDRLLADLGELGASTVWMREEAHDSLVDFAKRNGFAETQRFVARGPAAGASAGCEIVVLEARIT
jgi:hypothetical protein